MKIICFWLVVVGMLILSPVFASTESAVKEIKKFSTEITSLDMEGKTLDSDDRIIKDQKKHLTEVREAFVVALNDFSLAQQAGLAEVEALDSASKEFRIKRDAHNTTKPDTHSQAAVDAYNKEVAPLETLRQYFVQKSKEIIDRQTENGVILDRLNSGNDEYERQVQELHVQEKLLNNRLNAFRARARELIAHIRKPCEELWSNEKTQQQAIDLGCGMIDLGRP